MLYGTVTFFRESSYTFFLDSCIVYYILFEYFKVQMNFPFFNQCNLTSWRFFLQHRWAVLRYKSSRMTSFSTDRFFSEFNWNRWCIVHSSIRIRSNSITQRNVEHFAQRWTWQLFILPHPKRYLTGGHRHLYGPSLPTAQIGY